MAFSKGSYAAMLLLRDEVFAEIRKHPHGITRRAIQKRFGASSSALEENRKIVWRLSSALAGLWQEQSIIAEDCEDGPVYYPRVSG